MMLRELALWMGKKLMNFCHPAGSSKGCCSEVLNTCAALRDRFRCMVCCHRSRSQVHSHRSHLGGPPSGQYF